jgi:hypothetical protein
MQTSRTVKVGGRGREPVVMGPGITSVSEVEAGDIVEVAEGFHGDTEWSEFRKALGGRGLMLEDAGAPLRYKVIGQTPWERPPIPAERTVVDPVMPSPSASRTFSDRTK